MAELFRFGVSLEKALLDKFDCLIKRKNYTNRSKAFRDLIRQELVKKEWQEGKKVAGAVTFIYDPHKRELLNKIAAVRHDFQKVIISAQHIRLEHSNCLEIVAIRGNPKDAQRLANTLKAINGIKHATLSMSSIGKDID